MVGKLSRGAVYTAGEHAPLGRNEKVVNADVDGVAIERAADAIAGVLVGIVQHLGYAMAAVGNGGIVEVAAHHEAAVGVALHVAGHGVGLTGALHSRLRELAHNAEALLLAFLQILAAGLVHHVAVGRALLGRQVVALKVTVDDVERVALADKHLEEGRAVGGRAAQLALADNGVARKDGQSVGAARSDNLHRIAVGQRAHKRRAVALFPEFSVNERRLLRADDVSARARQIAQHGRAAVGVLFLRIIAHHVEGHELQALLGGRRRQIDGHVLPDGEAAAQQTHNGNPHAPAAKEQREHQHTQHPGQKTGKHQSHPGQHAQTVGVDVHTGGRHPQQRHGRQRTAGHQARIKGIHAARFAAPPATAATAAAPFG